MAVVQQLYLSLDFLIQEKAKMSSGLEDYIRNSHRRKKYVRINQLILCERENYLRQTHLNALALLTIKYDFVQKLNCHVLIFEINFCKFIYSFIFY